MADKQSRVPCPAIIGFTSKPQQTSMRMSVRDSTYAKLQLVSYQAERHSPCLDYNGCRYADYESLYYKNIL